MEAHKKLAKTIFYELNPRYYFDAKGTGIGNIKGLIQKFDYFKFLGVENIILQDALSTDSKNAEQSFKIPAVEIGDLKEMQSLLEVASKAKVGIFLELNVGSIKESNKWFESATSSMMGEMHSIIPFVSKVPEQHEPGIEFVQSKRTNEFYPLDQSTREIPLNWKAPQVFNQFLEIIKLWHSYGVTGFVIKNFELINTDVTAVIRDPMSESTLLALHKLYQAIKKISNGIIVVGKTNQVPLTDGARYTFGAGRLFDFFYSTEVSMLGTKNGLVDMVGQFRPGDLVSRLNALSTGPYNILAFGSNCVGRIVSRWGNDEQFHDQSAKTLAALLFMTSASNLIYYGDEIGTKNIGLNNLDDFQDRSMELRKKNIVSAKYSEQTFMDAQSLQNPINARSLMSWSPTKNGGFSTADHTITTQSKSYGTVNVATEFGDPSSILNFYKRLIYLVASSPYASLIADGTYHASVLLGGVVRIRIQSPVAKMAVYANLSAVEKNLVALSTRGKVLLSSYTEKTYAERKIPRKLLAYETLIVVHKGQVHDLPPLAHTAKKADGGTKALKTKPIERPAADDLTQAENELIKKDAPSSLAKTLETPMPKAPARSGQTKTTRLSATKTSQLLDTSNLEKPALAKVPKAENKPTSKIEIAKRSTVAEDKVLRSVDKGGEGPTSLLDSQVAKTTQVDVEDVNDIESFLKELDKGKSKK